MGKDHLDALVAATTGMTLDEIKTYYEKTHSCRVHVDETKGLFCPRYRGSTKFNKLGALATRGTVFALNEEGVFAGEVACVPFYKFFNADEEYAYKGESHDVIAIQRKLDGSLVKVFHHNGEWIIASNMTSNAAPEFQLLFERCIGLSRSELGNILNPNQTYVFEMCSPENKIILAYEDFSVTLLMTRCKHTLEELEPSPVHGHFSIVENVGAFDPREEGEEGVVVVYNGGHRVKMKTDWYIKYHHKKRFGLDVQETIDSWGHVAAAIHCDVYDDICGKVSEALLPQAETYRSYLAVLDSCLEHTLGVLGLKKDKNVEEKAISKMLSRMETENKSFRSGTTMRAFVIAWLQDKSNPFDAANVNSPKRASLFSKEVERFVKFHTCYL